MVRHVFSRLRQWFGARRRGEVRVAPAGTRGRVYAKKGAGAAPAMGAVRAKPKATVTYRIIRKGEE